MVDCVMCELLSLSLCRLCSTEKVNELAMAQCVATGLVEPLRLAWSRVTIGVTPAMQFALLNEAELKAEAGNVLW